MRGSKPPPPSERVFPQHVKSRALPRRSWVLRRLLVDECFAVRGSQAALARGFEGSLRCRQLGPASGKLRRQMGKLRVQVHAQLFDGVFQPVVGGNLLRLAHLHRLQVGQNHIGKQLGKGSNRLIHEGILMWNSSERIITVGPPPVMYQAAVPSPYSD